ncbi:hypothetical protein LOD99_8960 [Oopsacas minuta]|uniref:Uncharacterized protein n=1 Tax=Oopsacas minuta TaxID=111878 RepID=A0AAV7JEQ4_9METZ|nr:hypothetical protein LOD99_8960 [Oopsacas minuta]
MKFALFILMTISAYVLGANAEGAYDSGSAGVDPINRKLGFDRGYIYFGVLTLGALVIVGVIITCIVFACMYRIHYKRAMSRVWRTKPGTRRLTESISSPEKIAENQPPPYMVAQVEIPPSYSETTPNQV